MTNWRDGARWMIGVDVGGTKVAAGFVNGRGEMGEYLRVAMNPRGTAGEGFAAVTSALDALLKGNTAGGTSEFPIGICAPGPLDPRTGVLLNPPNVPCSRGFPLTGGIQRRYRMAAGRAIAAQPSALGAARWRAG